MSDPIIFVTGNKNKLREVQKIFGNDVKFESIDIDLPELQETPENIATKKCELAYDKVTEKYKKEMRVIVEDTSLGFNCIKGLPGPYIKGFLKKLGCDGLWELVSKYKDHTGWAQCVLGYMNKKGMKPITFVGKLDGEIVKPRGDNNFGWDPIFQPKNFKETFAEMKDEVKNKISHRTLAFVAFKNFINKK